MFERRVVRGNTHGSYILSKEDEYLYKLNQQPATKTADRGRNPLARRAVEEANQIQDMDKSAGWGDKRSNKVNVASYTEKQLINETDLPASYDATTQTDFVIEKEIPDLRMPVYKGISKETQIYANELPFDFNYESEPIVQVLLTRVLEESRIEVLEEQELHAMKQRQEYLLAHKAEVKRKLIELEDNEKQKADTNVGWCLEGQS